MRKFMFLFGILAFLTGCSSVKQENLDEGYPSTRVSNGGGAANVTLIVLEDGTKCAVLVGYKKAGISCDWEATR